MSLAVSLQSRGAAGTIARTARVVSRFGATTSAMARRLDRCESPAATLDVLRSLGLRYHSSQAVVFPLLSSDLDAAAASRYALALRLYSAVDARAVAVRPRLRDGLVDIPVAVPDDEILLDRIRVTEPALSAEWLHILELTYRRGDLFTIQLHPERVSELGQALEACLTSARVHHPAVHVACLDDL